MLLVKNDNRWIRYTLHIQQPNLLPTLPPSPDTPTVISAYAPAASQSLTHVKVHGAWIGRDTGNHNVLTDRMEISASGSAKSALNYRSKETEQILQ